MWAYPDSLKIIGRIFPNFQASFFAQGGLVTILGNMSLSRPGKTSFFTSYVPEHGGWISTLSLVMSLQSGRYPAGTDELLGSITCWWWCHYYIMCQTSFRPKQEAGQNDSGKAKESLDLCAYLPKYFFILPVWGKKRFFKVSSSNHRWQYLRTLIPSPQKYFYE